MSYNASINDTNVAVKQESTGHMPIELDDDDSTSQIERPNHLQSSSLPLAVCCNPPSRFDESDELGVTLLEMLKTVSADITTYRNAMLAGLDTFHDAEITQLFGTNFKSLPRCIQFFISEHYKNNSDESFASTARRELNVADSTFIVEMGNKSNQISFIYLTYPAWRQTGKYMVIANLPATQDSSRFIHAIITPIRTCSPQDFSGMKWAAHEYCIWPLDYAFTSYRIIRLRKQRLKAALPAEVTEEDSGSSHQHSPPSSEVIPSIEIERNMVSESRVSKRNSAPIDYNVRNKFADILKNAPKRRRQRRPKVQQTSGSQLRTQDDKGEWPTASSNQSSADQDSVPTSNSAAVGSKAVPSVQTSKEFQIFYKAINGASQEVQDAISSVGRHQDRPETQQSSRLSTKSVSTMVDMDESTISLEGHLDNASGTTQTSSTDTSTKTSVDVESPGNESTSKSRTIFRFINELKGIDTPVPLSECETHDDLHDLAVIHMIATSRTRLLRVEFDDPDNYQILVSDQPEHFEARFTNRIQALHTMHATNPEKQFTIKVFNSDRVRR